jgi:excisionase family DNA binding protein
MSHSNQLVDEDAPTGLFARPVAQALDQAPSASEAGLWDANDVARYLKVSRSWVYQRAEAGLLPYARIGGLLRFDPHAVRTFARGGDPDRGPRNSSSRRRKAR